MRPLLAQAQRELPRSRRRTPTRSAGRDGRPARRRRASSGRRSMRTRSRFPAGSAPGPASRPNPPARTPRSSMRAARARSARWASRRAALRRSRRECPPPGHLPGTWPATPRPQPCRDETRGRNAAAAASKPRRTWCRRGRSPRLEAAACAQAEANYMLRSTAQIALTPPGLAPVQEGAQAFLPFFARAQARRDLRSLLARRPLANQAFRLMHGLWACGQQVGDHTIDGGVEIGCNLLDEPDPKSRLGVEALAG